MKCTFSININGEKLVVLEDITEDVKDINDLERLLKRQSPETLSKIKKALQSVDQIEELQLDNINENAIGVYSPAELINSLSKIVEDARLLRYLTIGKTALSSKIVIAGFGNESVPTQYKDGHVFLNMNYIYDSDNKIIALTELAANTKFPGVSVNEILKNDEQLRGLVDSDNDNIIKDLTQLIKSAYYRANLKLSHSLSETRLTTERDNIVNVYNNFSEKNTSDDYTPKERIRVENLKQGDLVLIPLETSTYKNGVYEMFYDSYVDVEGNTILRTLVNTPTGVETRNRIAQIYSRDGQIVNIRPSDIVEAKTYNPESINISSAEGIFKRVKVRFSKSKSLVGITYGSSILDMLKSGAKVIIKKESYSVNKVKGSNAYLSDGKTIPLNEIMELDVPVTETEPLTISEDQATIGNGWVKYKDAVIGEEIAFKKNYDDTNLTVAKVIGLGVKDNQSIIYYNDGKDVSYINEYNIKFMGNPPNEYIINTLEANDINKTLNMLRSQDGKVMSTLELMTKYKSGAFRESIYSIQDLNKYSQITPKDIIVDRSTGVPYKIVSSKRDKVKLTHNIGGRNVYLVIDRDNLDLFTLLTKRPVNGTFANSNIIKNRYNLYADSRDNSVEAKVYKKPNGFIYSLQAKLSAEDLKNHVLYESGDKDYTNEMKKELKDRYGWDSIPEKLYMVPTDNGNSMLKDTNNTIYLPMTNNKFDYILSNVQKCVVPGTFLTFKGDHRAYLVEKVYKDSVLLSYYHYTSNKIDSKNKDLNYVKSTKTIFKASDLNTLEISGMHLPRWADVAFQKISEIQVPKSDLIKRSDINLYPKSDSPELVMSMVNFIKNKYNVKVNIIHNRDLAKFNDPSVYQASAFVSKDGIYVNIDRASIEEPLHELLHLVLTTMKSNDSATYYQLVNSVQYHPMFAQVMKNYSGINSEMLEEAFVKLLSSTFRNNILKDGVFNETSFSVAIKQSISDLMGLTGDLTWEDPIDLLNTPVNQILFDFGSKLVNNEESLIDDKSLSYMFDVAKEIDSLLKNGNLTQKCDF